MARTRGCTGRLACTLALVLLCRTAAADLVVDTGPGPGGVIGGPSLDVGQFRAAQFVVQDAVVVTSVEGWISAADPGDTATVAIYSNGATNLPATVLHASAFTLQGSGAAAWEGASGLAWHLAPGTYWAAFRVDPGQTLAGAMPQPVPMPLPKYAFFSSFNGAWAASTNTTGLRIDATAAPAPVAVPVPGLALVVCGLLLAPLGVFRSRRRAAR